MTLGCFVSISEWCHDVATLKAISWILTYQPDIYPLSTCIMAYIALSYAYAFDKVLLTMWHLFTIQLNVVRGIHIICPFSKYACLNLSSAKFYTFHFLIIFLSFYIFIFYKYPSMVGSTWINIHHIHVLLKQCMCL